MGASHVLEAAEDGGEERVGGVHLDEADAFGAGVSRTQIARPVIRLVAELSNSFVDPLHKRRTDAALLVDHPGHRLETDTGRGSNVTHGGALPARGSGLGAAHLAADNVVTHGIDCT